MNKKKRIEGAVGELVNPWKMLALIQNYVWCS